MAMITAVILPSAEMALIFPRSIARSRIPRRVVDVWRGENSVNFVYREMPDQPLSVTFTLDGVDLSRLFQG